MLTVRVPVRGKEAFNLYVNGRVRSSVHDRERGTLFEFDGRAVLQYGWIMGGRCAGHRRAYVVSNLGDTRCFGGVYLPNVREPCAVISCAYGRRVDLMRQALFNLERIAGKDVYLLPVLFWQRFACLVDDFDGKRCRAVKSNLILLCESALRRGLREEAV